MELTHTDLRQVKKSTTPDPLLTLLIPSWNNLSYLQLCIRSIRAHSRISLQIIVHVNEGVDGTLQWIDDQIDIDYTYSKANIGVCYALNYSRALIRGEYVVFLNDDMYVCPGWDTALMDEVRRIGHPWFFLSATMIEPQFTSNASVIVRDFGMSPADFRETALLDAYTSLVKEDWMGATWPPNVVHRSVWDLVGGYSIEYSPGMYSDPDFSMKLWAMGVRYFKGVGASRVYHFGGTSTKKVTHNKGYATFIGKWGFAASWLTQKVLKRGLPFSGEVLDVMPSPGQKAKMAWKRISAAFKTPQ